MAFSDQDQNVVRVTRGDSVSPVVLICEHASFHIPAEYDELGLSASARRSHAAWDPGAEAVARHMSNTLGAALVASRISRLVYDCNRPPEAKDAMPSQSETFSIPGNRDLTDFDRNDRVEKYYQPFHQAVAKQLKAHASPVILTIHSFTPVYHGVRRDVEIGLLHDKDTRLADAFLNTAAQNTPVNVQRNAPYGPEDGVTHTLKKHALPYGFYNLMVEIRNDLIASEEQQVAMAELLCAWLIDALATLNIKLEPVSCRV